MNPALERILSDALRLQRPYVGKPFKSGGWECRTEPRPEWEGFWYEVLTSGVWRRSFWRNGAYLERML